LNRYLKEEYLQCIFQGHSLQASCSDEKSKFVKAILTRRYLLEELIDGFKAMGVLDAIRQYPEQFLEVLCKNDTKLDAIIVDFIFEVHLAEDGTNIRPTQERAVVFWRDFLQDCCGK
jgi:hypothetical protein